MAYDCAIIGTGPAGVSAALTLKANDKNFVLIGSKNFSDKVEQGRIVVDRGMHTNLPGVFAAGDCTGRPYQYVKAAGEGNVAAHSVVEYLAENK